MRISAVVACSLLTGCIVPVHRGLAMERRKLWAPPGAPVAFSWVSRVEQRVTKVTTTTKDDLETTRDTSNRATRTIVYAVDPVTQREQRLGELAGDGGEPVYYDAARRVLWLRDDDGVLAGLGGAAGGPAHGRRQILVDDLAPPFVLAVAPPGSAGPDTIALYDLRTDRYALVPAAVAKADVRVDGDVVRFTSLTADAASVHVHHIAIDWASGAPLRRPDVTWTTPPLSAADGERVATAMLPGGERYAEVVRDASGTRLIVFDVATSTPQVIPLTPPADAEAAVHLVAVDAGTLVFGVAGDPPCWRGSVVQVTGAVVTTLPERPCVRDAATVAGRGVLVADGGTVVIVDAAGSLVELAGVDVERLRGGIPTGPTTRAVLRRDASALVDLDLATGAQTAAPLVGVTAADRLLALGDGSARFARGNDTLVTVPLAASPVPTTRVLAAPVMTSADRMPRDRTELWLGGGGGVTTRGHGAGRLSVEVATWVSDRWTLDVRAHARFEGETTMDSMTAASAFDAGAAAGYTWHRLPRLWSLSFGGALGANYAAAYAGETRTDRAFAPSAEVHLGGTGSMFGVDVSALVPSLLDLDRGALFLLNMRFGFTENLR